MIEFAMSPEHRTFASPKALAHIVADWLRALALLGTRFLLIRWGSKRDVHNGIV